MADVQRNVAKRDVPQRDAPLEEPILVDLIQRAQSTTDQSAFDGLYLLYADRVFRYLMARVDDVNLAEDITSQVFIRLLEKIGMYRVAPKDNVAIFSAWLYRMTYNKMVDVLRKQKRKRAVNIDRIETLPSSQNLVAQVEERFDFEVLMQKLKLLNEQQRQVILLRFIEGMSIAETAKIMQKSEGAIKALQHRALENLRQFFGNLQAVM